jgi:protein-tyrosine-phosphatase
MTDPAQGQRPLPPLTLLFVCTGNAGRSQLAQAFGRRLFLHHAEILSAGVAPWEHLHPVAVEIFVEEGLPLVGHVPKSVQQYRNHQPDVVVTIGDPARTLLPESLREVALYRHWDISDPADAAAGSVRKAFRQASATIQQQLAILLAELSALGWIRP